MNLTPSQAKWSQTVGVALVGVLTDAGAQFAALGSANLGRSALIGMALGGAARLLGAFLSGQVTRPDPPK